MGLAVASDDGVWKFLRIFPYLVFVSMYHGHVFVRVLHIYIPISASLAHYVSVADVRFLEIPFGRGIGLLVQGVLQPSRHGHPAVFHEPRIAEPVLHRYQVTLVFVMEFARGYCTSVDPGYILLRVCQHILEQRGMEGRPRKEILQVGTEGDYPVAESEI